MNKKLNVNLLYKLALDIEENVGFLKYSINPIGTDSVKKEILKDLIEIEKIIQQIKDNL